MRQRLANSSRADKSARGRQKWDLTQLGHTADGWNVRSKIAFDTKVARSERAQPAEGITQISDTIHLTNGVNDMIFTLRALTSVVEGRAGRSEETFAREMSNRLIKIISR